MAAIVVTAAERGDVYARGDELGDVWPEYNRHGDVLNRYWRHLPARFAEFQFVLYDEAVDEVLAQGHSIPCTWDGAVDGLPAGADGLIAAGFDQGHEPNVLGALAIEIAPAQQGRGLARVMVEAMLAIARAHGLSDLVAPVRPSWKERYPLTPIDRYARWRRADGLLFDPWMRVHERVGGDVLKPEPESLRITGSVAEWEAWTGMAFPESGTYVFPHGLAPLELDRETDAGRYWEPNVWMRHRVGR